MRQFLMGLIVLSLGHFAAAKDSSCSYKMEYKTDAKDASTLSQAFRGRAHFSCPGKWKGEAEMKVSCGDAKTSAGQTTVEFKNDKLEVIYEAASSRTSCIAHAKKDCEMASSSTVKSLKKIATVSLDGKAVHEITCDSKGKVTEKEITDSASSVPSVGTSTNPQGAGAR